MQKRTISLLVLFVMCLALALPLVTAATAHADKLTDAIAATPQGTEKGQIDPTAKPGFLGIPGAPAPGMVAGFLWAVWVGWIFSTVGAFGGVMAGVGHISVFGLGSYAKSFQDTNPTLNKLVTDSIRVSNQWMVGLSSLVSSITYARQKRLVVSLGVFLGAGALIATYLISQTAGKVSFSQYQGWFGLCVLLIGAFMIYDMSPKGMAKKQAAKAAVKAFEETVKCKGDICEQGVKTLRWSMTKTEISFFGQTFSFNPLWALLGGFFISALAAFIGVGGGFLYVPFLTSVVGLPMFVVAGTSALAVLISMVTSIFQFMTMKGVPIYWPLIGVELVGVFVGSILGPRTGKYIPEKVLKWIFLILAFYIGLGYTLKGFWGVKVPM